MSKKKRTHSPEESRQIKKFIKAEFRKLSNKERKAKRLKMESHRNT